MKNEFILSLLSRYGSLFLSVFQTKEKVLKDLIAFEATRLMVFPCDIIDLRNIFLEGRIESVSPILLFSQRFAEKYLKSYSIFLVMDSERISIDNSSCGAVKVFFSDFLPIHSNIIRIIVNETSSNNSFNFVKQLVQEFGIGAECLISNNIPGVSFSNKTTGNIIPKKRKYGVKKENYSIDLTPIEKQIFDFLRQFQKETNVQIKMYVAGGWVLDKLLKVSSDDIDIATNLPGTEIVKLIKEYADRKGVSIGEPFSVSLDKSAVPLPEEKVSSDLMVGGIDIFGVKIEFVPMRKESYPDASSRKPVIVRTNDPKEDVKRRDLTINAILYNIETGKIEDYVGGIKDLGLKNGRIYLKTPDNAHKTFTEDPLRLLRVLRFHAKYPGSIIDPSIKKEIRDPEVHSSYARKVASERAGKEIMKIMMSENPVGALRLLFDSGLYRFVFDVPSMRDINADGIHMDQKSPYHKYNLLDHTLKVVENINQLIPPGLTEEEKRKKGLTLLAAVFHDFGKMDPAVATPHIKPQIPGHTQYVGHEKSSEKMAEDILESIGATKEEKNFVKAIIRTHMYPHEASQWSSSNKIWKGPGKFVEKMKIQGKGASDDLWKYVFFHAQADAMSSDPERYREEDYERGRQWFQKYYTDPSIEFTRNQGAVIRGDVVKRLYEELQNIKGVSISPKIINDAIRQLIQMQYRKVIDMSFTSMPDGEEREKSFEKCQEEAIAKTKSWLYGNYQKYIKSKPQEEIMGGNWFKKIKISQAIPEGKIMNSDPEEIVTGPKITRPKYRVGDKVRDRRKGMVNPQDYGKVEMIKGNKIKIVWNPNDKNKKREEIYDMVEDTHVLSLIVTEV